MIQTGHNGSHCTVELPLVYKQKKSQSYGSIIEQKKRSQSHKHACILTGAGTFCVKVHLLRRAPILFY
jgi:hypothetical protein